jgi:hypothetical protein
MHARLMHVEEDFELQQPLPRNERALTHDLELSTLLQAMGGGDAFLLEVARKTLPGGLRSIAEEQRGRFESVGIASLFSMIIGELDDDYLAGIRHHLAELRFRNGAMLSAERGKGNEGARYVPRRGRRPRHCWLRWVIGRRSPAYPFRLADRDEAGARILAEMRDRGINSVANALA